MLSKIAIRDMEQRLFQQMHQSEEDVVRVSGRIYCNMCGYQYSQHTGAEEYWGNWGDLYATRLCDGRMVHL